MGAINTVLNLLKSGDHVVAGNDLYGGTYRLCTKLYEKLGIEFTFVNLADLDNVRAAMRKETKLVMVETPSNPLLRLCDIEAVAKLCKEHGTLLMADNTFASSYLQNPLDMGADIVMHSTTKYMGGHSDVVGGALVVNDPKLHRGARSFFSNTVGATPGPLDCFLVLRGTKTLHVRMDRHCDNAEKIARCLDKHPAVSVVHYPGLPSHPQHEIAKKQMRPCGRDGVLRSARFR